MKHSLIFLLSIICCPLFSQITALTYLNPNDFWHQYQTKAYAIIVDVRKPKEFRKAHIPKAINIPDKMSLVAFSDSLDTETPIFIYCKLGIRSDTAALWLDKHDFSNINILKYGLQEWRALDMETVKSKLRRRKKRNNLKMMYH